MVAAEKDKREYIDRDQKETAPYMARHRTGQALGV
jgi:hypothetical protein